MPFARHRQSRCDDQLTHVDVAAGYCLVTEDRVDHPCSRNAAALTALLGAASVLATSSSYVRTTFSLSVSHPKSLAGSMMAGAWLVASSMVGIIRDFEPRPDVPVEVMYKGAFAFATVTLIFGPFLVLTPTKPIVLKKQTLFKRLVQGAQRKETRYVSLAIFSVLTLMQGFVVYSLYTVLVGILQLEFRFVVGILVLYSLLMLFYLVIFYSTMTRKPVVIKGVNLMEQIRRNCVLRRKGKKDLDILGHKHYVKVYLAAFALACGAVAAVMYAVITSASVQYPMYGMLARVAYIGFITLNALTSAVLIVFILNVAFRPLNITTEVAMEDGTVIRVDKIKWLGLARAVDRVWLMKHATPGDPHTRLIVDAADVLVRQTDTAPGVTAQWTFPEFGVLHQNNHQCLMAFVATGPQYPGSCAAWITHRLAVLAVDAHDDVAAVAPLALTAVLADAAGKLVALFSPATDDALRDLEVKATSWQAGQRSAADAAAVSGDADAQALSAGLTSVKATMSDVYENAAVTALRLQAAAAEDEAERCAALALAQDAQRLAPLASTHLVRHAFIPAASVDEIQDLEVREQAQVFARDGRHHVHVGTSRTWQLRYRVQADGPDTLLGYDVWQHDPLMVESLVAMRAAVVQEEAARPRNSSTLLASIRAAPVLKKATALKGKRAADKAVLDVETAKEERNKSLSWLASASYGGGGGSDDDYDDDEDWALYDDKGGGDRTSTEDDDVRGQGRRGLVQQMADRHAAAIEDARKPAVKPARPLTGFFSRSGVASSRDDTEVQDGSDASNARDNFDDDYADGEWEQDGDYDEYQAERYGRHSMLSAVSNASFASAGPAAQQQQQQHRPLPTANVQGGKAATTFTAGEEEAAENELRRRNRAMASTRQEVARATATEQRRLEAAVDRLGARELLKASGTTIARTEEEQEEERNLKAMAESMAAAHAAATAATSEEVTRQDRMLDELAKSVEETAAIGRALQAEMDKQSEQLDTITENVDQAKAVVSTNLEKLIDRGERIESLVDKSEDLSEASKLFLKNAKKQRGPLSRLTVRRDHDGKPKDARKAAPPASTTATTGEAVVGGEEAGEHVVGGDDGGEVAVDADFARADEDGAEDPFAGFTFHRELRHRHSTRGGRATSGKRGGKAASGKRGKSSGYVAEADGLADGRLRRRSYSSSTASSRGSVAFTPMQQGWMQPAPVQPLALVPLPMSAPRPTSPPRPSLPAVLASLPAADAVDPAVAAQQVDAPFVRSPLLLSVPGGVPPDADFLLASITAKEEDPRDGAVLLHGPVACADAQLRCVLPQRMHLVAADAVAASLVPPLDVLTYSTPSAGGPAVLLADRALVSPDASALARLRYFEVSLDAGDAVVGVVSSAAAGGVSFSLPPAAPVDWSGCSAGVDAWQRQLMRETIPLPPRGRAGMTFGLGIDLVRGFAFATIDGKVVPSSMCSPAVLRHADAHTGRPGIVPCILLAAGTRISVNFGHSRFLYQPAPACEWSVADLPLAQPLPSQGSGAAHVAAVRLEACAPRPMLAFGAPDAALLAHTEGAGAGDVLVARWYPDLALLTVSVNQLAPRCVVRAKRRPDIAIAVAEPHVRFSVVSSLVRRSWTDDLPRIPLPLLPCGIDWPALLRLHKSPGDEGAVFLPALSPLADEVGLVDVRQPLPPQLDRLVPSVCGRIVRMAVDTAAPLVRAVLEHPSQSIPAVQRAVLLVALRRLRYQLIQDLATRLPPLLIPLMHPDTGGWIGSPPPGCPRQRPPAVTLTFAFLDALAWPCASTRSTAVGRVASVLALIDACDAATEEVPLLSYLSRYLRLTLAVLQHSTAQGGLVTLVDDSVAAAGSRPVVESLAPGLSI